MTGSRNLFGVWPEYGDEEELHASKWRHVARIRPDGDRPAMVVRHR